MPVDKTKALTTAERVRRELRVAAFDKDTLATIEDLIDAASAAAETLLNRGALAYDAAIVERCRCSGGALLFVTRRPVIELLSVFELEDDGTYDVDEDAVDLTDVSIESEGRTGILNKRSGWPFTGDYAASVGGGTLVGSESQGLLVTYRGGYVLPDQATEILPRTLPKDLELAIVYAVTDAYQAGGRDQSIASTSALTASVTFVNESTRKEAGGVGIFSPRSMALLRPYRRIAMGRTP